MNIKIHTQEKEFVKVVVCDSYFAILFSFFLLPFDREKKKYYSRVAKFCETKELQRRSFLHNSYINKIGQQII